MACIPPILMSNEAIWGAPGVSKVGQRFDQELQKDRKLRQALMQVTGFIHWPDDSA